MTAADLSRTALVLAMGADTAGKQELGAGVLDDAHLVVDTADAFSVGESAYLPDVPLAGYRLRRNASTRMRSTMCPSRMP